MISDLQSVCILAAEVGSFYHSEGEHTQALKLIFDSQTLMLRFKEARKLDYIDHHLAANLITFLVFWSLEQFDQAHKYANSCRRILKKITSKRTNSRGNTERPK